MKNLIDLTYNIEEGMTTFSTYWHPLVEISKIGRLGFEGRETRKISMGTHTGTHMDAPLHFIKNGISIDKINLENLIGNVTIIDLSHLLENQPVIINDIANEKIGTHIIFKFGWGKFWGQKKFYQDYPYFSEDVAKYLIDKGVKLIGLDTPSPDDSRLPMGKEVVGTKQDSPIHKLLLSNNIILVEYLANLNLIDDYKDWNIVVLPLKLTGADGSPVRAALYK